LSLSEKQIQFIQKNYKTFSTKEMSKQLNVSENDIEESVKEIKGPAPKWFYLLLFVIPILFFILLEAGLRLFNYGNDTRVWVDVSKDMQILNPEIGYRYFFTTKNLPFSVESFLYKEKKESSFRVFVVGASSAAGYPYLSSASLSKFVRKKLEILYPEKVVEVANFSMSAINSYTIRDLMPELLKKQPDLILIYLGHNEYYGALGVGSLESLGSSRFIVNTTLWLNKFKTIELLRSIVKSLSGIFSSDNEVTGGTLMAQMAQDKLIKYDSEIYWAGIEQFEGNLRDIFSMCKDAGVPVIASTLSSNLKDQKPFVSIGDSLNSSADYIYDIANEELHRDNPDSAKALFVYAKDLDALRFRAPEEINRTIIRLCKAYNYPFIRSDSILNSMSKYGIVGDNLMTDHLHPNVLGYQLIGNLFFSAMKKYGYLPTADSPDLDEKTADSLVIAYYNFTPFDSTVADFRIKILKNDWPYIDPQNQLPRNHLINLKNSIDTVSIEVIDGRISREQARLKVAEHYLKQNQFDDYAIEMAALIEEFPFIYKYYNIAAKQLITAGKFSRAYYFLKRGYKNKPDAFNSKWLGIIDLSQGFVDDALSYLELSLKYDSRDAQTYFNITGAYAQKKEFNKALESINKCLQINPDFQRAKQIREQLTAIINQNNRVE
jgi:lysophospholipase L1-like esterase